MRETGKRALTPSPPLPMLGEGEWRVGPAFAGREGLVALAGADRTMGVP